MKNIENTNDFITILIESIERLKEAQTNFFDFKSQNFILNDKELNIFQISWYCIKENKKIEKYLKDLFHSEKLTDNEKILFFNKCLSSQILPEEMFYPLYELNTNKNAFYSSFSTLKDLYIAKKLDIPIWIPINIKDKTTFLPTYIWDKEEKRKDISKEKKTKSLSYFTFFNNYRDEWIDLSFENLTKVDIHSSIAYHCALFQRHKNYIKELKITLDTNNNYINSLGQSNKISHLLFRCGLIKLVHIDKNTQIDSLDILRLVTSVVPTGHNDYSAKFNQINNQKKFSSLWFTYLDKTDFNYVDSYGNLANHTFAKARKTFYIPLREDIENINQGDLFRDFSSTDEKDQKSLISWLTLLDSKNVNFNHKDKHGISAICSLFNYLVKSSDKAVFFGKDAIIEKIWNKSSAEQKKIILDEFMSDWDEKFHSFIKRDLDNKYNSWATKGNTINIIELFVKDDIFKDTQYIEKIFHAIEPYKEKAEHIKNLLSLLFSEKMNSQLKDKSMEKCRIKI